jgi:hypothetical protein
MADPENGAPPDPELLRLKRELDRATLRAQLATQQREALTSSLVPVDTKPLEGTTTVDAGAVIETEILAYRMLRRLAAKIAADVERATQERAILIHSEADMAALTAFRAFDRQLAQLAAAFDDLAAAPAPAPDDVLMSMAAVVATTTAAKAVLDFTSLFRRDRTLAGVAITMEDLALVSEVGGALARRKRKVFVTHLYPHTSETERIESALDAVRMRAAAAHERIGAIADEEEKRRAQDRYLRLDEGRRSYEDMITGVVAEGSNALATLVRGAGVDALLNQERGASVLYLKILKAAGTNETRRNLFRSTLKRSGGVVVNYILFDTDGSILLSSTADAYSGAVDEVDQ